MWISCIGKILFLSVFLISIVFASITFQIYTLAYGPTYSDGSEANNASSSILNSTSTKSNNSKVADIAILSHKLKNSSGYLEVDGEIKNTGNATAESLAVILTGYDFNDIVGTDSAYSKTDVLKPGQTSKFKITSPVNNFKEMKFYDFSFQWKNSDGSEGYIENAQIYKVAK